MTTVGYLENQVRPVGSNPLEESNEMKKLLGHIFQDFLKHPTYLQGSCKINISASPTSDILYCTTYLLAYLLAVAEYSYIDKDTCAMTLVYAH